MSETAGNENAGMPAKAQVQFNCNGHATGKMRNDLEVMMKLPFEEGPFVMANRRRLVSWRRRNSPPAPGTFCCRIDRVQS